MDEVEFSLEDLEEAIKACVQDMVKRALEDSAPSDQEHTGEEVKWIHQSTKLEQECFHGFAATLVPTNHLLLS